MLSRYCGETREHIAIFSLIRESVDKVLEKRKRVRKGTNERSWEREAALSRPCHLTTF